MSEQTINLWVYINCVDFLVWDQEAEGSSPFTHTNHLLLFAVNLNEKTPNCRGGWRINKTGGVKVLRTSMEYF